MQAERILKEWIDKEIIFLKILIFVFKEVKELQILLYVIVNTR